MRISLLILSILAMLLSCDAPRNNPLDPANPDNIYHTIKGIVKSQNSSRDPITDATVFWPTHKIISRTNVDGYFQFDIPGSTDGWLFAEKENYWNDSTKIIWGESTNKSVDFLLNSVATIDSFRLYSIFINKWGLPPTEKVAIEVSINDMEKDVDSVHILLPMNDIKKKLEYNIDSKFYEKKFSKLQLNISGIDELVGKNINIEVRELSRLPRVAGSGTVKRVIQNTVNQTFPISVTTNTTPLLEWDVYDPGFKFSFMLEIYIFENQFPELVWSRENISSDSTSFRVDTELSDSVDEYYWVIWVIDEWGNRLRTNHASFKVE